MATGVFCLCDSGFDLDGMAMMDRRRVTRPRMPWCIKPGCKDYSYDRQRKLCWRHAWGDNIA